ncbi:PH domain-containing protein [Sphingomonas mesophila]|uniref:PH domain-containing protein n=1 Tax=Sphingomonas mesophila TaxID=2303576 RepID=UPI000E57DE32|nr:PH domain-containing protein [Sphingomonas mesophila]
MTDAAVPAAAAPAGRGERLHPLYLLTSLPKVIKGAWGIIAGGAYLAFQDKLGLALLLLGAFLLFSIGGSLVRWLTFRFQLDDDELRVESGLINRSSRSIPFDRVTDVDIEQGPLHRLFGLARVRMETGASSAAKDSEGVLDTITLDRAEAIRQIVRAHRSGTALAQADLPQEVAETDSAPLFAMTTSRVLIAGLFNFSLAIIAALFGASQTLGDVIGFDPFSRAFWLELVASTGPLRDYVVQHRFVAALGGTLVLAAIGIGTGMIRTMLREHGFRLERTHSGFRRRRGLLTLTDVTIPARRVQASLLQTGPVRRRFGWFELKFQSLASDGGEGSHVVAPLAREYEADAIQQSLDRPMSPAPDDWRPVAPGQFRSAATLLAIGIVLSLAAAALLSPWALLGSASFAALLVTSWLEHRRSRYALSGGYLFLDGGWWKQRLAVVPVARIQSMDIAENSWTRLFRFVRMRFGVAGGSLLSSFAIDALDRADAEALREQLVAQ